MMISAKGCATIMCCVLLLCTLSILWPSEGSVEELPSSELSAHSVVNVATLMPPITLCGGHFGGPCRGIRVAVEALLTKPVVHLASAAEAVKFTKEVLLPTLHSLRKFGNGVFLIAWNGTVVKLAMKKHFRNGALSVKQSAKWARRIDFRGKDPPLAIFHVSSADEDVRFFLECRAALAALVQRVPFLFLLVMGPHYDCTSGFVGSNVLPVPDDQWGYGSGVLLPRSMPFQQRGETLVAYRGSTMGRAWALGGQFRFTDRYRVVDAFHNVPRTYVKFSNTVQRVKNVPAAFFGGRVDKAALMNSAKVMLHVDGNSFSSSLKWKLQAGCCIVLLESSLRSAMWFFPMLRSGKHLVAVQNITELVPTALSLARNVSRCEELSVNAANFYLEHVQQPAAVNYLKKVVTEPWQSAHYFSHTDMRIKLNGVEQ